ncbi:MAG: hypothetical protein H7Z14_17730, partial [Anaerolineae bacterium]|nr:hypothetical protein [Phycisphaerae bacterium]
MSLSAIVSADSPHARSPRASRNAIFVCALLLIAFGLLCYLAVSTKSATADEPLHVTGAYAHVFMRDYRLNPEDPPLWNYWVMLPRSHDSLHLPTDHELWRKQLDDTSWEMPYSSIVLFTAQNDGARFIQSSRPMMVVLGVALGALIACWAWQVAGRIGAIVATTLFAFDPNLLAHAALVKNDVAFALVMTAMCFAVWRVGRRATLLNVASAAIALGAAMTTKFSGVLLAPMLVAMISARALVPSEWLVVGRPMRTARSKLLAATMICAVVAIVSWAMIWLAYGFRFDATPDPGSRLPTARMVTRTAEERFFVRHNRWPSEAELKVADPGLIAHATTWAERHHLLPQAWLYGFLYTYQSTLVRTSFLLGRFSETGWWYYFPLAMAFKTPISTIGACVIALVVALLKPRHPERYSANDLASIDKPDPSRSTAQDDMLRSVSRSWTLICMLIPIAIYMASAMTTNLNLGLRHVLPVYPIIYLLIAMAASRLASLRPRIFKWSAIVLGVALVAESVVAFPNYIAFFNAPSRPYRLHLLSDSNLDWGQDLLALSRWQAEHPSTRLYLCYFGSVDPAVYGINYINLPGGTYLNNEQQAPDQRGVIA